MMRIGLVLCAAALGGCSSCATTEGGGPSPSSSTRPTSSANSTGHNKLGNCTIFPADNPWNRDVSGLEVHPSSDAFIDAIGRNKPVHPDFGTEWEGAPIGIPFVTVAGTQPPVPIEFVAYGDESDPGPYPVPPDAPVEGGTNADGDRHVIVLDRDACKLYELYRAFPVNGGERWRADSGAVWDLNVNDTHPNTFTSADAAGLPILPGLIRYDEVVERGALTHAVRFTVSRSYAGYIAPAVHYASDHKDPSLPPMGLRLRMKASFDCSGMSTEAKVICAGLKRYGLILADNGSDWFLSGAPDPRWNDDALGDLKSVTGDAFEAVFTGDTKTY